MAGADEDAVVADGTNVTVDPARRSDPGITVRRTTATIISVTNGVAVEAEVAVAVMEAAVEAEVTGEVPVMMAVITAMGAAPAGTAEVTTTTAAPVTTGGTSRVLCAG